MARKAKGLRAAYAADPQPQRERVAKWAKENPGKAAARVQRRKARILKATPQWADLSAIRSIYETASELGLHVDHIVPLRSPLVCGLHCEANLRMLQATDNLRKGNRWWPDAP